MHLGIVIIKLFVIIGGVPLITLILFRILYYRFIDPPCEANRRLCEFRDKSIRSTMEKLTNDGLDHADAPRLISRLEWWKTINRCLNMLENTTESIKTVAKNIELLFTYYQPNQPDVEEDFVRAIFTRALQDPTMAHLYVKLVHHLEKGKIDHTRNIQRKLLQLTVDEFNRPIHDFIDKHRMKTKKLNNIKLMAALMKRSIVKDECITDCANNLVRRLKAGVEHSSEQLCLFLTTLLVNEPDDDNHLLASQQAQLLVCFQALQQAAQTPQVTGQPHKSECGTDTQNQTDIGTSERKGKRVIVFQRRAIIRLRRKPSADESDDKPPRLIDTGSCLETNGLLDADESDDVPFFRYKRFSMDNVPNEKLPTCRKESHYQIPVPGIIESHPATKTRQKKLIRPGILSRMMSTVAGFLNQMKRNDTSLTKEEIEKREETFSSIIAAYTSFVDSELANGGAPLGRNRTRDCILYLIITMVMSLCWFYR